MPALSKSFAERLLDWQLKFGRHHLPWQNTGSAYHVWLSEIMLQQTQVATVISYYQRFIETFPTIFDLAKADAEQVMHLWQGLGYYSRARNLHACAKQVVAQYGGHFPANVGLLEELPGVGRSTAGAIASLGLGVRAPILDGNVKRVFCRHWAVDGYPEQGRVKSKLWSIAEAELPVSEVGRYNQALMDLGATVCKRGEPSCEVCPVNSTCLALKEGRVSLLPAAKPKRPKVNWFFVAFVSKNSEDQVFLTQRPDEGLWRLLWMPPIFQLKGNDKLSLFDNLVGEQLLNSCFQLARQSPADIFDDTDLYFAERFRQPENWVVHELTHRRIHVFTIVLDPASLGRLGMQGEWCAPSEKPLAKLTVKLLDRVNHVPVSQQNVLNFGQ